MKRCSMCGRWVSLWRIKNRMVSQWSRRFPYLIPTKVWCWDCLGPLDGEALAKELGS
jgi:hypothetical protein